MAVAEYEEIIPNPRGLIRTFSGHNYTFGESVADLIDNSLDAGATSVRIVMEFDGPDSFVAIADNGKGLAEPQIREALRPGTERAYDSDDKGKFGLGLKTASLRHCSQLTLVGRSDPKRKRIAARELDVEHIEQANKWTVKIIKPPEVAAKLLDDTTGTVVVWNKIGKLMGFQHAWGRHAENHFNKQKRELEDHLSMVFHRFLAGEARRKKPLEIWLGNLSLEPWDPFARDEPGTKDLGDRTWKIAGSRGSGLVVFRPYILPNRSKFSAPKAFERYGRANWNSSQGFYVYRADRLIQSGGWSRMRTQDEHTKYARASIDFQRDLDDAFELNVSKNWLKLPEDLRGHLETELEVLFRAAKKAYKPDDGAPAGPPRIPPPSLPTGGGGKPGGDPARPSPPEPRPDPEPGVREALEEAARAAGELPALRKVVTKLRKLHPGVASGLGW
jgi:hypothetical protein